MAVSAVTAALTLAVAGVALYAQAQSEDAARDSLEVGAALSQIATELRLTQRELETVQVRLVEEFSTLGLTALDVQRERFDLLVARMQQDLGRAQALPLDAADRAAFTSMEADVEALSEAYASLEQALRLHGDDTSGAESQLRRAEGRFVALFARAESSEVTAAQAHGPAASQSLEALEGAPDDAEVTVSAGSLRASLGAVGVLAEAQRWSQAENHYLRALALQREFDATRSADIVGPLRAEVESLKTQIRTMSLSPADKARALDDADNYQGAFTAYVGVQADIQAAVTEYGEAITRMDGASAEALVAGQALEAAKYQSMLAINERTRNVVAGAGVLAVLLGAVFTLWLNRSLAPIGAVTRAARNIARGDVAQEVTANSRDEIGDLGRSMREMVDYLTEMAAVADAVAAGDVSHEVTPRSDRDALGNAFVRMQDYLRRDVAAAHAIAEGDLTVEVEPVGTRDALGHALRAMAESIRTVITDAAETAESLAEAKVELVRVAEESARATQDVSRASEQVAAGTAQQARGAEDVAEGMRELAAAVAQVEGGALQQRTAVDEAAALGREVSTGAASVSQEAETVKDASEAAGEVARDGAERVGRTIERISRIKESMDVAGATVTELGARSNEIGKIVAVIDDIAAQTNLLALNAAIEAARAGDQGRGFAVVADEVRILASRVATATKDIEELIGAVQGGVEASVQAVSDGNHQMERGMTAATEAGEALGRILESVEHVSERVRTISERAGLLRTQGDQMAERLEQVSAIAVQNQSAAEAMRQVTATVNDSAASIAAIAEENSASAEETSASVQEMSAQVEEISASTQELGSMADALRALIQRFRLSSDAPAGLEDGGPTEEPLAAQPGGVPRGGLPCLGAPPAPAWPDPGGCWPARAGRISRHGNAVPVRRLQVHPGPPRGVRGGTGAGLRPAGREHGVPLRPGPPAGRVPPLRPLLRLLHPLRGGAPRVRRGGGAVISSRACDLCAKPLGQEVVRLTMRHGQVALLVQQRWRIDARPAGLQVMTICRTCHDYMAGALEHMIATFGAAEASDGGATGEQATQAA